MFLRRHTRERVKEREHRAENTNNTNVGDFCTVQRLVFKNSSVEALPSLVKNLPLLVRHARHFLLRTRSNPLGVWIQSLVNAIASDEENRGRLRNARFLRAPRSVHRSNHVRRVEIREKSSRAREYSRDKRFREREGKCSKGSVKTKRGEQC